MRFESIDRRTALAITATIAVVATGALPAAAGTGIAHAVQAFWNGAFGSWDAVASSTLVRATPLILTGLAVALAFQAGIWNIGAEGQLLAGATAASAIALAAGTTLGVLTPVAALAAGMLAGAVWAGVAAWLRAQFGVLEVISTIMLNFVALYGVGFLVRGPLQEATGIYPQSPVLPEPSHLPWLLPGSRLHAGFALALVAAVGVWWALQWTALGFRIRATGKNPTAAAVAGEIDIGHTTTIAFLASGALAGLAGAVEVTGVTFALYENLSPGYGYIAIAVALLAGLHPLGTIAAGILFGALNAGTLAMQRDAGVPAVVAFVVEGLLVLGTLLIAHRRFGLTRWGKRLLTTTRRHTHGSANESAG